MQRKLTHKSRQPLFFSPFSAFPRTDPSLSLANILRHLWGLSHEDSLSTGGLPVSGTASLPAALASREPTERGFFLHYTEMMTQYNSGPDELFLPPTPNEPPMALHTHTSIFGKMRTTVRQRHSQRSALDITGHPITQPGTRRTSRTLLSCDCDWLVYWGFSSRGQTCCNCALISGGQQLAGLFEWSVNFFFRSSHNSKTSCVLAHVCSSLLLCYIFTPSIEQLK